jgi:hypothetical protein
VCNGECGNGGENRSCAGGDEDNAEKEDEVIETGKDVFNAKAKVVGEWWGIGLKDDSVGVCEPGGGEDADGGGSRKAEAALA